MGRPPKFSSPEQLQALIDDYFNTVPREQWIWTGLCLHCDCTRETFNEYADMRPEYTDTIKKALSRVQSSYESDLKSKGNVGAIFALKNFGWKDKTEQDVTVKGTLGLSKILDEIEET